MCFPYTYLFLFGWLSRSSEMPFSYTVIKESHRVAAKVKKVECCYFIKNLVNIKIKIKLGNGNRREE